MLKYESVWKLLKEHNFNMYFMDSSKYYCIICKGILKNSHQSPCGCRYCSECISDYLGDEAKYCPGEMEDCKEQLIVSRSDPQIDYVTNKEISQMVVKCPMSVCFYLAPLKNMEDHLNGHMEKCPYYTLGCTKSVALVEHFNIHFKDDIYSHAVMLAKSIESLRDNVASLKRSQRELKIHSDKENEILDNLENETEELCNFQNEQRNHFKNGHEKSGVPGFVTRDRLQDPVTHANKHRRIPVGPPGKPKNYNEFIFHGSEYGSNDSFLGENTGSTVMTLKGLTFLWRIENFREKLKATRSGSNISLTSNSFYLPENGYRFCLKVYPYGKDLAKSTHLSVFIHLMKGDFDHLLPWPMRNEIRLCLVDQIYGNLAKGIAYTYDSTGPSEQFVFNKPTTNRNSGFGELQFITLSELFNNSRIFHNDSILLRCFSKKQIS